MKLIKNKFKVCDQCNGKGAHIYVYVNPWLQAMLVLMVFVFIVLILKYGYIITPYIDKVFEYSMNLIFIS